MAEELVRSWQDHTWDREKLEAEFQTSFDRGLSSHQYEKMRKTSGLGETLRGCGCGCRCSFILPLLCFLLAIVCMVTALTTSNSPAVRLILVICILYLIIFCIYFAFKMSKLMAKNEQLEEPLLAETIQVKRDGEWSHIDARQLVPGDIVRVEAGL